ncbi:MAG: hypothetical protein K6E92_09950 [Lachnospiraceae bacterium]|nr:hypothetical protein [Lachnospiraceae bacterium]
MADRKREEENNILSFERPSRFRIEYLLLVLILIYMIVVAVLYFSSDPVVRYEVVEGSLSQNNIYRAVVIRDETVFTTPYSGYVNFLAREGQRVSNGDLVCTVDETGKVSEYLEAQSLLENSLSDRELTEFQNDIADYMHGFDRSSFSSLYDFKYTLKNTVLKLANAQFLDALGSAEGSAFAGLKYLDSMDTGIITYYIDGCEDLTADTVSKELFDGASYQRKNILGNDLRAAGDPVYKLSSSENWSVVFPIDDSEGEELLKEDYIKVRFLKNQLESWGKVSLHRNEDGSYLELSFTNSMVTFATDRFLDVELLLSEDTGLKIPVSSIAVKEFFLIDKRFVTEEESSGNTYVIMQGYNETGGRQSILTQIEVYSYDEKAGVYYVDDSILSLGDILELPDSSETCVVKAKGDLRGVYNINKGFADFKEITVLYQNEEYAIVRSNTRYGLRVYDYIVLDASSVRDDQFINK